MPRTCRKGGVVSLEEILTTSDLCEIYAVSRQAVAGWRAAGLPSKSVGSGHIYDKKEVEKWLSRKTK